MSTLSTTFPLDGTISHERAVSGSVNSIGRLSGNLNRNGIIEAAVEVFHFTVAPNNRVTFTDVTSDRLNAAISDRKTVLAYLFKQNASIEEYKTLVLSYYDVSGKYIFNADHDGITYKISTINGGVIWEYSALRTDGENLLGLETSSKGSLVSAINEVNADISEIPIVSHVTDEQGDRLVIEHNGVTVDNVWLYSETRKTIDASDPATYQISWGVSDVIEMYVKKEQPIIRVMNGSDFAATLRLVYWAAGVKVIFSGAAGSSIYTFIGTQTVIFTRKFTLWTLRESSIPETGLPAGGVQGDIMIKRSDADGDAEWLPPANSAEQDNTRPITAAAVYTEIGNINALLATI